MEASNSFCNNSDTRFVSFDVSNFHAFHGKFYFREPFIMATFSVDKNRTFINDGRNLKYSVNYSRKDNTSFDLNAGFEETIYKPNGKVEKINILLEWIMNNKNKILQLPNQKMFSLNTDFVCFRGLLTTLFCTPYQRKVGWIVCATKFNGTIYLCQYDTDEDIRRNSEMSEKDIRLCSYGYKFEQYMTCDKPGGHPDVSEPVNQNEEFDVIFRTRLNKHSVMSCGEIDCIDSDKVSLNSNSASKYVELKTSRVITHRNQEFALKKMKMLKWWAQSFIIGIPKIICGFRDDDGIVCELKNYETLELPTAANNMWEPEVCVNCCDQLLAYFKSIVTEDDSNSVYKFVYHPYKNVTACKLKPEESKSNRFLHDGYIQWMHSQQ